MIIPEEWKSSRQVWPSHRAQLGCYFLLIEEMLRIRPSHGFIVLGDGTRHRIDNTEELRAWVLDLAGQIRAARKAVTVPILVNPKPASAVDVARGVIVGRLIKTDGTIKAIALSS